MRSKDFENALRDALDSVDDDLNEEAVARRAENMNRAEKRKKGWDFINRRPAFLIAAAAALILAAVLIPLGVMMSRKPEPVTPVESKTEPITDQEETDRFEITGLSGGTAALVDNNVDRVLFLGIIVQKTEDGYLFAANEGGGFYLLDDLQNRKIIKDNRFRHSDFYVRLMCGARDGGFVYCPGIWNDCGGLKTPGIFRVNIQTGEIETYLVTHESVDAIIISNGTLYYITSAEIKAVTDEIGESYSVIERGTMKIKAADMSAQTIKTIWSGDDRIEIDMFCVHDGVIILGNRAEDALLKIDPATGECVSVPIQKKESRISWDQDRIYLTRVDSEDRYVKIDVYDYNGNLLFSFENEGKYEPCSQFVGMVNTYLGKMVATLDQKLYLVDLENGKAELISDYRIKNCSVTVCDEKLWIMDHDTNRLLVFDGETQIAQCDLNQA